MKDKLSEFIEGCRGEQVYEMVKAEIIVYILCSVSFTVLAIVTPIVCS